LPHGAQPSVWSFCKQGTYTTLARIPLLPALRRLTSFGHHRLYIVAYPHYAGQFILPLLGNVCGPGATFDSTSSAVWPYDQGHPGRELSYPPICLSPEAADRKSVDIHIF
jgi:hypothetical protein